MIHELNVPIRERDAVLLYAESCAGREQCRPRIVSENIPSSCGNCGACDTNHLADNGAATCAECGVRFSLRIGEPLHDR